VQRVGVTTIQRKFWAEGAAGGKGKGKGKGKEVTVTKPGWRIDAQRATQMRRWLPLGRGAEGREGVEGDS